MMIKIKRTAWIILFISTCIKANAQDFVHPGLLTGTADIARIKKGLTEGQQDVRSGFEELSKHPQSQFSYQVQGPLPMVGRNPTVGQNIYDSDANAAYQNALMWVITGDIRHAKKAIEIIAQWCGTLKSITGRDAVLMAGLGPFKMVNAAELLRYTNSGWTDNDTRIAERHFRDVIYPVIREYAPFANGNWDSATMKTVMAISIFCNDRNMFENALNYYQCGAGDGCITNYIINEAGQCQESGRDQSHTQLGIAHLADCCEMAWHQGLDLYALQNNRLLKGFEYTAQYNLGYEVPFKPTIDRTGKYLHRHISIEARGKLRAIYEEVYNHYVRRRRLPAPFTEKVAEKVRPEAQGSPGADHTGFGTLLYSRAVGDSVTTKTAFRPAGVVIKNIDTGNEISWPRIINAGYYRIERATKPGGPFRLIANKVETNHFTDISVSSGKLYYYSIAAVNKLGQSLFSTPRGITAGLPAPWKITDIGAAVQTDSTISDQLYSTGQKAGVASFNGSILTLNGFGKGADSLADHFTLLYQPQNLSRGLVIKYVPQFSAQSSQLGITIRNGLKANAANIMILLHPVSAITPEAPVWRVEFLKRDYNGHLVSLAFSDELKSPAVTYGRMTGPIWLKLLQLGNKFTGSYSTDGLHWLQLGQTSLKLKGQPVSGIIAGSGSNLIDTEVTVNLSGTL